MIYTKILQYVLQNIPGCRISADRTGISHKSDNGRYVVWTFDNVIYVRGAHIPDSIDSTVTAGSRHRVDLKDPDILTKIISIVESYITYRLSTKMSSP